MLNSLCFDDNQLNIRHLFFIGTIFIAHPILAQVEKAPARHEGDGPFGKLIIRGVTLINSTGAPPVGPVDIVVEKNRIKQIKQVGFPGVPIDSKGRPQAAPGDKELNCEGMYLMPGFVDMPRNWK